MTQRERLYTYPEFDRFTRLPEHLDRRFGLLHGEIYEVSPTRPHSKIVNRLHGNLFKFHETYGVGELHIELRYKLPGDDHNALIPDISFIEHVDDLPDDDRPIPRMPDLAIEVKSPDQTYKSARAKAAYYLANGTRLVWLLFPEKKQIEVHRPDQAVVVLGSGDMLDGGEVLPGFSLAVSEVFRDV